MKRLIKIFFSFIILFLLAFIIYLNAKLYYKPNYSNNINTDIIKQLHFLKSTLHGGAADKMQQTYPEGFVFTQAVYGLSWTELANVLDHNSDLYKEAYGEISWALNEIHSGKGKNRFDKTLPIPYGAYYTGWSNYLLGKKLSIENSSERDSVEIAAFKTSCNQINNAINESVYPESYRDFSWPADVFVSVASLSLYDKLFEPVFEPNIRQWLQKVKANTDKNGFIPYAAAKDGKPTEIARGSAESLMLNFLIDIDPVFAKEQFSLYKEKFLDYRFGLPGIREFPKENENTGNVDSGPVIMDMGSAATIVGMRVLALYDDSTNAIAVRNGIEALGFAYTNNTEKKYLFGEWPMADVFITWAHTTEMNKSKALLTSESWRLTFQLYSILFITILIILLIFLLKKNKRLNAQ